MTQRLINSTLAADLVGGGTLAFSYPSGTGKGNYSGSLKHKLATVSGNIFSAPQFFTLTFAATTVTVNWTAGSPIIPAGTAIVLQLSEQGYNGDRSKFSFPVKDNVTRLGSVHVNLGSMAAASATAVCAAQAIAGAVNAVINGGLAVAGVAIMDFARNLQFVSSNVGDTTQTVTVTGTDDYGVAMTETKTLNGTTVVAGLKAFKTITKVAVSAALVGNLSVGSNVAMGLPVFLATAGNVIKEIVDLGVVTTGTFVNGITAKNTALVGDVRGTYTPATASDGTHSYELLMLLEDYDFLGQPQV